MLRHRHGGANRGGSRYAPSHFLIITNSGGTPARQLISANSNFNSHPLPPRHKLATVLFFFCCCYYFNHPRVIINGCHGRSGRISGINDPEFASRKPNFRSPTYFESVLINWKPQLAVFLTRMSAGFTETLRTAEEALKRESCRGKKIELMKPQER